MNCAKGTQAGVAGRWGHWVDVARVESNEGIGFTAYTEKNDQPYLTLSFPSSTELRKFAVMLLTAADKRDTDRTETLKLVTGEDPEKIASDYQAIGKHLYAAVNPTSEEIAQVHAEIEDGIHDEDSLLGDQGWLALEVMDYRELAKEEEKEEGSAWPFSR